MEAPIVQPSTCRELQRISECFRRIYCSSERFKPFRKESFVELFVRAVEKDVGITLRSHA